MRFSILVYASLAIFSSAAPAPVPQMATSFTAEEFIVVMKPDTATSALSELFGVIGNTGFKVVNINSFTAVHGKIPTSLQGAITSLLNVAYIERVISMQASATIIQRNAPWGLNRISHRDNNIATYQYDDSAGAGTYAYVIDTGVYAGHNDFGGRAELAANFAGDGKLEDGNGHGTHCAGTIGSTTYGVSKKIQIIGVKVLDARGSGSSSGVLDGIEFAVKDAMSKGRIRSSVGSMSLGGLFSRATNDAVAAAVDAGLFMAVAAGNDGRNARLTSPASEPKACTVGATDKNDNIASYSNYGSIVDVLAPGSDIQSTWNRGPDDTNTISGTSMATPHVAGLAAYLIALEGQRSPQELCQRIKTLATKNKLTLGLIPTISRTANALAYNGIES